MLFDCSIQKESTPLHHFCFLLPSNTMWYDKAQQDSFLLHLLTTVLDWTVLSCNAFWLFYSSPMTSGQSNLVMPVKLRYHTWFLSCGLWFPNNRGHVCSWLLSWQIQLDSDLTFLPTFSNQRDHLRWGLVLSAVSHIRHSPYGPFTKIVWGQKKGSGHHTRRIAFMQQQGQN